MPSDIHGILLLDKPLGVSSAAAVARIKRLFGARKAGHTGSLDPLASGMLPICLGEATKFGSLLLDADKTYRVTVRLGERTPSADRETEIVERRELPDFSVARMDRALAEFPREYAQVPPMYAAIKQDGKPLYEYARAGVTRERAARAIVIREMRLLAWRTPDLTFDVRCTKGAYMRVLAEDLAAQLGTVGHLAGLRRLGVAPFSAEPLWTFEALDSMAAAERQAALMPVDAALSDWRRFDLPPGGVGAFRQGQTVSVREAFPGNALQGNAVPCGVLPVDALPGNAVPCDFLPGNVRIYAAGFGFLGLGAIEPAGRLVPIRLIASMPRRA